MGDVSRARSNRRGRGRCLPVAATSMGRFGVAKDSSAMLVLPGWSLKGAADLLAPVLLAHWSYLLELPSARMRQMSRLREPQGSKSGGREGLVAAWLGHFRLLL